MAIRSITIKVDSELAEWFDSRFPYATKQAFLEQCLLHLRAGVESGALPLPNVYPARSALQAFNSTMRSNG